MNDKIGKLIYGDSVGYKKTLIIATFILFVLTAMFVFGYQTASARVSAEANNYMKRFCDCSYDFESEIGFNDYVVATNSNNEILRENFKY